MWDALREKKIGVRILLGIVVGVLGIGMLLYLVPQGTSDLTGTDAVADVAFVSAPTGMKATLPTIISARKPVASCCFLFIALLPIVCWLAPAVGIRSRPWAHLSPIRAACL